ncbi:hypothetical protein B0H14DRAFT_3866146 [Mycena olivaceomarginata]|nr:hypothetical protein B0H14DRAFT_3866146 [Mycena olivaceomarginata]
MFTLGVGLPLVFFAFIASSPTNTVQAALTNVTIDDTNSNFWTFAGSWNVVTPTTPCVGCFAQPDPGLAHNSTWHDGDFLAGSFTFQGSAVYIYGIDIPHPANILFAMNNPTKESFHHYSGEDCVYNSLFFSATSLDPKVPHTVTWILETSSDGGGVGLFDYAVVTVDQATDSSSCSASNPNFGGSSLGPSSSTGSSSASATSAGSSGGPVITTEPHKSKTGPIVGAVVGVVGGLAILGAVIGIVGGLAILGALILFYWRRKSATTSDNVVPEPYYHPLPANNTGGTGPTPGLSGIMLVKPYRAPPAASSGGAAGYPSENAFTMATVPPSPASAARRSSTSRQGLAWDGQQQHPNAGCPRDLDVEARLTQLLEEFAAISRPPAYS